MKRALGAGVLVGTSLLLVGATIQLSQWGKPEPPRLHLVAREDRDGDGEVDRWEYQVDAPAGDRATDRPAERFLLLDEDGDGRADRFSFSRAGEPARTLSRPTPSSHLILCVDGVPFEMIESLWRAGHFREFFPPARLISTFPSSSDVALSVLLHAPPSPGYENRYFDRAENRLKGGARVTFEQEMPYRRRLDYALPGLLRGPAYIFPEKAFFDDLARLRTRVRAWRGGVFIAHLSTADALLHTRALERVSSLLLAVEALVRELFYERQGEMAITILSDHGNTVAHTRVDIEGTLRAAGYRLSDRVSDARHVVIPSYGLIGAVAVYAHRERRADLARLLAQVPGVDLSLFRDGEEVFIESRRGRARIRCDRERHAVRYEPVEGDPLDLLPTLERLRRMAHPDGFFPQSALLEATADHTYPDALRRICDAMMGNQVENPADLLLSLEEGYYFGSRRFDWFVRMKNTHGSLTRRSSTGFIMSTERSFAHPIPIRDALAWISRHPRESR